MHEMGRHFPKKTQDDVHRVKQKKYATTMDC